MDQTDGYSLQAVGKDKRSDQHRPAIKLRIDFDDVTFPDSKEVRKRDLQCEESNS